jgi:metallothionein
MASKEGKKCAHPVCSCAVTSGKYCSTQCEAMEKTPDIACKCGHPGCKGYEAPVKRECNSIEIQKPHPYLPAAAVKPRVVHPPAQAGKPSAFSNWERRLTFFA